MNSGIVDIQYDYMALYDSAPINRSPSIYEMFDVILKQFPVTMSEVSGEQASSALEGNLFIVHRDNKIWLASESEGSIISPPFDDHSHFMMWFAGFLQKASDAKKKGEA